jgi:hypothetical protein
MQGSLSEFRLAELLQLVAVQQKTGLLRLTHGRQLVTFYFDHGVLVATRDRRHSSFDPLLDYLMRVGWIQSEMAGFLRTRLEGSKEDLADVLIGERFLSETDLRVALDDLAQELVHHAFSWRDGTYQFIGGDEALAGLQYRLSIKIDSVLMEAARRADEWPRLREKLPGPDVVLDLARAPESDGGDRAFRTLLLITGPMRLGDLVRAARIPEFETYEVVAQAVESGAVRIVEKPPPAPEREPTTERPARRPVAAERNLWTLQRPLGWGLALGLSVVCAVVAVLIGPLIAGTASWDAVRALRAAQARERVRMQIEVHRAVHGHYPATLDELLASDLARHELLRRAEPMRYAVARDGTAFMLTGVDAVGDGAPSMARSGLPAQP